jgi:hypothetical protein
MREEIDPTEEVIAQIAAQQHGITTIDQLREAGLEKSGVSRRVRMGRLHRVHQGVYAVGHFGLGLEARWMAAVLACGPGAALSHRSAAVRWGLLRPADGLIDVSAPTRAGRVSPVGVCLHRCRSLTADLVIRRNHVPVTTPARTVADLRKAVPAWEFRRAVRQAELRGLRLGPDIESDRTRSDLERDFLRLCRRYRLPPPEVNVRVGRWTVDFLWRAECEEPTHVAADLRDALALAS